MVSARAEQAGPAVTSAAPSSDYQFRSDAGLLLYHVRPERASDFESILARVRQGLESATDAARRQQASGLRMFRSTESVPGVVVYVAVIEPVIAGSDYDPVRMLTELLPGEATSLYERLREAVVKIERVGLARLR